MLKQDLQQFTALSQKASEKQPFKRILGHSLDVTLGAWCGKEVKFQTQYQQVERECLL